MAGGGGWCALGRAREKGRGSFIGASRWFYLTVVAYRNSSMGAERWRRAAEPTANGEWRFARRRVRAGRVAPA
jgi:hypothetical protein